MMRTSSVPLYFPDGVPLNVQRIEDPDAIHKLVAAGLKGLEADWKKLSSKADAVLHGDQSWAKRLFGRSLKVDFLYVMNRLYRPMSQWPRGLNAEEKGDLNVLRYLRQYTNSNESFSMSHLDPMDAPTEDEMAKAFKMLAKDGVPVVDRVDASFQKMLVEVGKEIEPLCESTYGEPCERGEGAQVAMADVKDLVRIGRFPSMTPRGARVMLALWQTLHR
jgi:hypothetical protein